MFLYYMILLGNWLKYGFIFKMRGWNNDVSEKKTKFYSYMSMKMIFMNPFDKVKNVKHRNRTLGKAAQATW